MCEQQPDWIDMSHRGTAHAHAVKASYCIGTGPSDGAVMQTGRRSHIPQTFVHYWRTYWPYICVRGTIWPLHFQWTELSRKISTISSSVLFHGNIIGIRLQCPLEHQGVVAERSVLAFHFEATVKHWGSICLSPCPSKGVTWRGKMS